jgi:hypothetical protein
VDAQNNPDGIQRATELVAEIAKAEQPNLNARAAVVASVVGLIVSFVRRHCEVGLPRPATGRPRLGRGRSVSYQGPLGPSGLSSA